MTEQQELDDILRQYPRLPHEQDEIRHALLDWHNKQIAKARLNEVQNSYEYWINGRKFISSYFRGRIADLSNSKEAEL